jgi:hypothetical protein
VRPQQIPEAARLKWRRERQRYLQHEPKREEALQALGHWCVAGRAQLSKEVPLMRRIGLAAFHEVVQEIHCF